MTEPEGPPYLDAFIGWLNAVVDQGTRERVSDRLGPGGSEQVRQDLSGSYLPAWRYVVDTSVARAHESFSRVAAPVLAGLSLPAIVSLATTNVPGQPYRDIALACFAGSTGLFLASFQLTIGYIYVRLYGDKWGYVRSGLTILGIGALAAAVTAIIAGVARHWWIDIALAVLCFGAATQVIARPAIALFDAARSVWISLTADSRPPQARDH